jgi:Xaa-Pro aminopeptidase
MCARLEKLRKTLAKDRVEALLVTSATNVRYLTGFTGGDAALLVTPARAIIVSDGRYAEQLRRECPDFETHIRAVGQKMTAVLADVITKLGVRKLGFEASAITVADFEELKKKLKTVDLVGVPARVEALRMIKDRGEVAAICEAIAVAERAFTMLRAGLRSEDSEKDAADALEAYLRRCGASAASFPPIVAVGANAALPHYRPGPEARLGQADFVLIDWGATRNGYTSDLTRVLVTGKVTSKFVKLYGSVLSAQERAIAAIRPGVRARDVDAEARSALEQAGFGRFFPHGLGHGLGLDIHEAPSIRKDADITLRPGMVVTIEPGIYLPGWGGIRIEDDVLVTPDGREVLTRVPKTLDALRP